MKTKLTTSGFSFVLTLLAIAAFTGMTVAPCQAGAISAGATLVVRTIEPISSVDPPGTRFMAILEAVVGAKGKVLIPTGTKVSGRIVTSKFLAMDTDPLAVDLTELQISGRNIPIKTTGAVPVRNNMYKSRSGVSVSRRSYQVPVGRTLEFRLAQPLNF